MCWEVNKLDGKDKGLEKKVSASSSEAFLGYAVDVSTARTFSVISHLDVCQLEDCLVSKTTSVCQVLKLPTACYYNKSF